MSRLSKKVQLRARLEGGLFGLLLLWGATLSALMAQAHASLIGHICGFSAAPHCAWCFVAASLAVAGLTVGGASFAPRRPVAAASLAS